jgi:serine/threonine protein kinase
VIMGRLEEPTLAVVAADPAPIHPPAELSTGHLLGDRYRIDEPIGAGGMSTVYRARDIFLNRPVAVKVFGPSGDDLDPLGIDDAASRIPREIRTHAGLRHPGVAQVFDAVLPDATDAATPWGYLVLELASGGSLAAPLRDAPVADDARALGLDIAAALAYLHARGIAHCDIQPSNIVRSADGSAKLIDLGVAVEASLPRPHVPSGRPAGTARYASPEQLRGLALSTATDVYSLGLVLLDVLDSDVSIDGRRGAASARPVVDIVPPDVPVSLGSQWFWLLTAMLGEDPARRPTAAAVGASVQEIPDPR